MTEIHKKETKLNPEGMKENSPAIHGGETEQINI